MRAERVQPPNESALQKAVSVLTLLQEQQFQAHAQPAERHNCSNDHSRADKGPEVRVMACHSRLLKSIQKSHGCTHGAGLPVATTLLELDAHRAAADGLGYSGRKVCPFMAATTETRAHGSS